MTKSKKFRNRRKNATKIRDDNNKELPELPTELLEVISKRLDVVDFCTFGVVCKNWWKVFDRTKEYFSESLAPMAILKSSSSKRACYLYDMANGNTKEVMFPNLVHKIFIGCSSGYIIIEHMVHKIYFINPLTGHEFNIQTPVFPHEVHSFYNIVIIIPVLSRKIYFIITIGNTKRDLKIFHSRSKRWTFNLNFEQRWVDIAIFINKIYFITRQARFGELRIKTSQYKICWLKVRNTPIVDSLNLKLVASNNQLLMVDFIPGVHLNIVKLDFDLMEWVKLYNLGDQALFFYGERSSSLRKPGKWGGQSNCVYDLVTRSSECCVYSMEAKLINRFTLAKNHRDTSKLYSRGWYYPHQSLKVDYLVED